MKLGKLPARQDSVSFKLASYLTSLPNPPTKAGHQAVVADWQGMLGNDQFGDCVLAGAAHETILWNDEAKLPVTFSTKSVLSDYSAITGFNPNDPNSDQGTDMQVAASYRKKTGVKDVAGTRHKVAAYLAIQAGNKTELKQAIYLFSAVGIGIQFPSSAMDQFNAGKPWTVVRGATIEGGHYVPAIGYDSRYVYVVTWGKVQKMSWGFFAKYCDEAICYLSTEMLSSGKSLEGFNVTQLNADLAQLPTQQSKGEAMGLIPFIKQHKQFIDPLTVLAEKFAITAVETGGAFWFTSGGKFDKVSLSAAFGVGVSAGWNIVLKPVYKQFRDNVVKPWLASRGLLEE